MNEYGEMVETYRQEKNPKYSDRNKTYSIVSLSLSLSLLQFIYELAWSETRTSPVRGRRLIDWALWSSYGKIELLAETIL